MELLWTTILTATLTSVICSSINTSCELLNSDVWTCDHIPLDIPNYITSVHIKDFMYETKVFEIKQTHFQSSSWKNVTHLKFSDVYEGKHIKFRNSAFRDLNNLEVLAIHALGEIQLEPFALLGLNNVTILDFSGCVRLKLEYISAALNGSNKVPNLTQLLLSNVNDYKRALKIDRAFSRCLSQKPLFHLDISLTHVSVLELGAIKELNDLTKFNISGAMVTEIIHHDTTPSDLKQINILDMSYIVIDLKWNKSYFHNYSLSNVNLTFTDKGQHLGFFLSPEILNISGVIGFDVMFYNIKFRIKDHFKSLTKGLIMMNNNIRRFDVEFVCDNFDLTSIKLINLAYNGLEYIHPSIFKCMSRLEHVDLSGNNLYKMYVENIQLFTHLLKSSHNLRQFHLTSNHLTDIPGEFFTGNGNLEIINLAGNRLTQVHFKLHNLPKLQVLNLANNRIKLLDAISIDYLDSLRRTPQYVEGETTDINVTINKNGKRGKATVDMKFNPLICDGCETLHSVRWLLDADLLDTVSESITCKSETGIYVHVNEEAAAMVQNICDRRTRNIILITITALLIVLCTGTAFMIYIRRKSRRKQAKRNDIINMLKVDDDRFFVFLSYSSDDEDFVTDNVARPLNEGLQRIIETDRNLVCRGDTEFRPGQQLHDELLRCIEKCSVFISVVSNHYCNSNFCKEEFNQALQMKTPVLLMLKDEVDIDIMSPAMKLLFRNNARILWENNNGEYRLKTSWENVCESILNIASDY